MVGAADEGVLLRYLGMPVAGYRGVGCHYIKQCSQFLPSEAGRGEGFRYRGDISAAGWGDFLQGGFELCLQRIHIQGSFQ